MIELIKTAIALKTLRFRPALQKRIGEEMLFEMPHIGQDPAIIMGVTRATGFLVQAAINAGHQKFITVGGKRVGKEDKRFTSILVPGLQKAGINLPSSPDIKEHEYAAELLINQFGIASANIAFLKTDSSTNFQQNMNVLKELGAHKAPAVEIYTLAGTAYRVAATLRAVWKDEAIPVAVHNVYPYGINRDNWMHHEASAFYALSEASKVLGPNAPYVKKGFCVPLDRAKEMDKVQSYIARQPT